MIPIPGSSYDFDVRGIEIEGGNDPGVDVQYPWEDSPRRFHHHQSKFTPSISIAHPSQTRNLRSFLMPRITSLPTITISCATGKTERIPKAGPTKPVTWVSIEDARAYAAWAGKRLPNDWEWQYAAQATDGRMYPWGNNWNAAALPPPDHGRTMRAPTDVNAFAQFASPFGVLDLEGNVSQWTNEFRDGHTRAAIIRGGAYYQPRGSIWYFPQTYRLDEHQKYLLMSPGRDRAGTIGFRCVVDAKIGARRSCVVERLRAKRQRGRCSAG